MKYKNAMDILPAQLISEIQKYFHGGCLWIPNPSGYMPSETINLHERDEIIMKLYENNVPIREIAKIAQISYERVRQVVKVSKSRTNRN